MTYLRYWLLVKSLGYDGGHLVIVHLQRLSIFKQRKESTHPSLAGDSGPRLSHIHVLLSFEGSRFTKVI